MTSSSIQLQSRAMVIWRNFKTIKSPLRGRRLGLLWIRQERDLVLDFIINERNVLSTSYIILVRKLLFQTLQHRIVFEASKKKINNLIKVSMSKLHLVRVSF